LENVTGVERIKIIELSLEDLQALQKGWGITKMWEDKGPKQAVDNMIILKLNPLDTEIQKVVSTKQLSVTLIKLPPKEAG